MKFVDSIYRIDGVFANSYLVKSGATVLIDSGMPHNGKKIIAFVKSIGIDLKEIKYILLTHAHLDHAGSADFLRKQTGAKIAIHKSDAPYLTGERNFAMPKGFAWVIFKAFGPLIAKHFKPDILLNDNDAIGEFSVISMPGHTEGSVAFYHIPSKSLFIGDTLNTEQGFLALPAERYNLSTEMVKNSLKDFASSGIVFNNLFPGHGEPIIGNAQSKVEEFVKTLQ
ncbi:MAG: MBL fold metallo-hydrolase [Candidatus Micrarchaeia archaeon]